MRVTILGSGTLVPNGLRGPAGYAVHCEGEDFLLDGGSGTLRRLAEAGIDFRQVDHLLYTHVHPDHTGDLVPFLFAQRHTPGFARSRPVRIFGPRRFGEFFAQVMEIYGRWVRSEDYACELRELWEDTIELGPLRVTTVPMRHPVPCVGYRLTGPAGETLAYTGDTDETERVSRLARDVDVLIAECSMPDELRIPGHLTPALAGRLAAAAAAGQLVLSHLYPPCDEVDIVARCAEHYAGEIVVAHDLMQLDIERGRVARSTLAPRVLPLGATPAGARAPGTRDLPPQDSTH